VNVKPPRILAPRAAPLGLASLQDEMMQERAATLGRLTRAFEEALAALVRFESESDANEAHWNVRRERLLDRAGEALWCFVVQREAVGLRNTEAVLRELQVPMAVRLRMGASRRSGRVTSQVAEGC
jgi:hypothetical protein